MATSRTTHGEGEAITRKAIEEAKAGNPVALRLCLDRIMPPRKDRTIAFALPAIETAADLTRATGALLSAVACIGSAEGLVGCVRAASQWPRERRSLTTAQPK